MKKILTLFLATTLFISCSDDDVSNARLNGNWNMETYAAFMPQLPILEEGDITWTFSNSGTRLQVTNNVEETYPFITHTGTYSVSTNGNMININGQEYKYSLKDNRLVISDTNETGDGPIQVFTAR